MQKLIKRSPRTAAGELVSSLRIAYNMHMDTELLQWSAGRDVALLRRLANPEVSQTETFNSIALFRKLFLEGAIHIYWKHLRPQEGEKFTIEYSSIRTKQIQAGRPYFFVLTGDQWADLLIGAVGGSEAPPTVVHGGLTYGPLTNHVNSSAVLAHARYAFTIAELIKYHSYMLGEVHLEAKDRLRIDAYDEMLLSGQKSYPVQFGSNGPSSLALKGFLNRVIRSAAFKHMYAVLEQRGYIPEDVEFPAIRANGLKATIEDHGFNAGMISLRWTERALADSLPQKFFPRLAS